MARRGAAWLVCALVSLAGAAAHAEGGPRIAVEPREVDLGQVTSEDEASHIFVLRNEGDAELTILNVKTSCACLINVLGARTIPPGGSTDLKVGFRDTSRGSDAIDVYLETNDPVEPAVTLRITRSDLVAVRVEPSVIDLGSVRVGDTVRAPFRVVQPQSERLMPIESALAGDEAFSIDAGETLTEGDTLVREFALAGVVSAPRPVYESTVTLRMNSSAVPILEIPVRARLELPIRATPGVLFVGVVKGGEEKSASVTVTPLTGEKLEGLRASCANDAIVASITPIADSADWTLTATCAGGEPERIEAEVAIADGEGTALLLVPVKAVVM